jgi:DNA-directed RNA polymerase subunit RPC12/RpoP
MHMQTHRRRDIACPVCGERRFASGANAVQHVESGYCSGCRGKDNARKSIYEFARQQQGMQRFMSDLPMLQNGAYNSNAVPDVPYRCKDCSKSFRQLSQLLQHQDNKHNQTRMIGY